MSADRGDNEYYARALVQVVNSATGAPIVFWLDAERPHDRELIKKVRPYIEVMEDQFREMRSVERKIDTLSKEGGKPEQIVELRERLAELYGSEAAAVLQAGSDGLIPGARIVSGEIAWAVDTEAATTLEDLVYRRLGLPLYEDPELGVPILQRLAAAMGARLSWSAERVREEIEAVRARLAQDTHFAASASVGLEQPSG